MVIVPIQVINMASPVTEEPVIQSDGLAVGVENPQPSRVRFSGCW